MMTIKTNISSTKQATALPSQAQAEVAPTRSRSARYGIIIVLTILATCLIIVTGFSVSFYYMHRTAVTAIQSRNLNVDLNGMKTREVIDEFENDVFRYTVNGAGRKFSAVEDYGRRTIVLRKDDINLEHCVILPMKKQQEKCNLENSTVVDEAKVTSTMSIVYRLGTTLIRNHELLGEVAQEMCDGYPLYWGIPEETEEQTPGTSRVKRRAWPCIPYCICCCLPCPCACDPFPPIPGPGPFPRPWPEFPVPDRFK